MAKRCDLTMATAHRLLTTMEALGVVVHTGPGEYAIGTRLLGIVPGSEFRIPPGVCRRSHSQPTEPHHQNDKPYRRSG
jgi:hypothetical protein